jgi:hypothetical protein
MMTQSPTFKNSIGGYLLKGLFFEETGSDKSSVSYTLKETDHEGFPSLYRLYMETNDPTEYLFATAHLSGWEHWQRLTKCSWFKPYVESWRKELETKFRALALQRISDLADGKSKDSFAANKFLVSAGWKDAPEKRRAGTPSKDEVRQETLRQVDIQKTLLDDYERIMN